MSLIITIYGNEGLVMASDSRTTESVTQDGRILSFPSSDSARKTFLSKANIGVSLCGTASLAGKPISGFVDKFIESYNYRDPPLTISKFANDLSSYLSSLKPIGLVIAHVAGFDRVDGGPTEKAFRCYIGPAGFSCNDCTTAGEIGAIWDGETETLTRLLKKGVISTEILEVNQATGIDADGKPVSSVAAYLIPKEKSTYLPESQISWGFLGLQDAVDFARFAIQTTIGAQRFLEHEKTVGGPIDVLVIKPDEAFWLSQKVLK